MNETEVLDLVEQHIRKHQPRDYQLNVIRQGVRHDGDWWYIVVQPDPPDIRAHDYKDVMEQTEEVMENQEKIKVLLVPALPGD